MISAVGPLPFVRPMRANLAPEATEPNPWPALEQAVRTAQGASLHATGPLAPALEQALQRFARARCSFVTDSFKPDPVLPEQAVQKILEGSSVKVAFENGAMAKLKSMADLRALDGLVGLGPVALEPDEKEALQAWDNVAARGFAPRHYGSDPIDARAQKLEALRKLREHETISLAGPGDVSVSARGLGELKTLDYMTGGPEWAGIADLERARTLRQASEHGLLFYRYSRVGTAYDQYSSSDPTMSVGKAGTPRVHLTLEQLRDLPATDALLEQARELHNGRLGSLYGLLKVDESPAPLPAAWTELRRRFSAPVADAAACELLQAAAMAGQSGWYSAEKVWQLAGRMGEFARDDYQLACLAQGIAPLLENGKQEDADRALMRLIHFERERELTDPEQTTLVTLVHGTRSISAATEGMDLVRIPLGQETLEEREQTFLTLGRSLGAAASHRTAEFYRTVLAEKLPAESLATTGQRLGRIYHSCAAENRENQALAAFRSIQRKLRQEPHTPEQADLVVGKFLHALLLGRDTKAALASLEDSRAAASVAAGERHVTIGGVRVPRRKPAGG